MTRPKQRGWEVVHRVRVPCELFLRGPLKCSPPEGLTENQSGCRILVYCTLPEGHMVSNPLSCLLRPLGFYTRPFRAYAMSLAPRDAELCSAPLLPLLTQRPSHKDPWTGSGFLSHPLPAIILFSPHVARPLLGELSQLLPVPSSSTLTVVGSTLALCTKRSLVCVCIQREHSTQPPRACLASNKAFFTALSS